MADDSGLCVDALDGGPGVLSARHGGPGLNDRGRYELVLQSLKGLPQERRGAYYEAALVLARSGQFVAVESGRCEGRILEAPRGEGGFGYDPIFFIDEFGLSMAELSPEQKDSLSHRARALESLGPALDDATRDGS